MANQVVEPGEIEVRLVAAVALDRAARLGLVRFQPSAQFARLGL